MPRLDSETQASPARRERVAWRRAAPVCLLLGWCMFWLVALLQPCCKLSGEQHEKCI